MFTNSVAFIILLGAASKSKTVPISSLSFVSSFVFQLALGLYAYLSSSRFLLLLAGYGLSLQQNDIDSARDYFEIVPCTRCMLVNGGRSQTLFCHFELISVAFLFQVRATLLI